MRGKFLTAATLVLGLIWLAQAQIVVNEFETAAADSFFDLLGTGLGSPKAFMNLTDDPSNPFSGQHALKTDWQIYATEPWGGFLQLIHTADPSVNGYLDFSSHKFLKVRFYNEAPADPAGTTVMRFKLHEASSTSGVGGDWEDWYFETPGLYDIAPGWNELLIPLKEIPNAVGTPPNNQGFSIPGWSGVPGDQKLDLTKVVGYSLEYVATTNPPPDSTVHGITLWDRLELVGDRYTVLHHFDNITSDTNVSVVGSGTGSITFSDNMQDLIEGTAAVQCDYMIDATEPFGGFVNMIVTPDSFFASLAGNSHLKLWYKVLSPASIPGNTVMRVELHDWSDGVQEVWYYENSRVLEDATGEWQSLLIPLQDRGFGPPPDSTGFSNPGWVGDPGNGKLDFDKIKGFAIDFVALNQGTQTSGSILFDYLAGHGKRPTDLIPPAPPTFLQAAPGNQYNLITWVDPPNEPNSTYDVYYSKDPITDVNAPGVEVVWLDLPYGTQSFEHLLFSPLGDSTYSYYYAVTATDSVGNVSQPTVTANPTTNTAKGIPTISLNAPSTTFAADGDLSEWTNVIPFQMAPSLGSHIVSNTSITDDNDLSVTAYLAMDQTYLYVAFDVTDDVIDTSAVNTWEKDSPDLFIGLYDWHGAPHGGYERGSEPDYHLRFNQNALIIDNLGGFTLLQPSSADYYWKPKLLLPGYIIEARIPLQAFADAGGDDLFSPVEGMRIPLDFAINDADGGGVRQGILTWSPYNDDTSWQSPKYWLYTWLGQKDHVVTGIEDPLQAGVYTYKLVQNYPNPFNPTTTIQYSLAQRSQVTLEVFNTLGQRVATLVNGFQSAGNHSIQFDASSLASGIYFYVLNAGDFHSVKKMVLLK
ncbi:MAG: T9SS C-terminal target domain-containing protein [Calditrichaeota bacterium]|nr:MAG: T9SS C-terminal target domain-containing protein [Calditrichota bacterium]